MDENTITVAAWNVDRARLGQTMSTTYFETTTRATSSRTGGSEHYMSFWAEGHLKVFRCAVAARQDQHKKLNQVEALRYYVQVHLTFYGSDLTIASARVPLEGSCTDSTQSTSCIAPRSRTITTPSAATSIGPARGTCRTCPHPQPW